MDLYPLARICRYSTISLLTW
jgi:hypothetical protein